MENAYRFDKASGRPIGFAVLGYCDQAECDETVFRGIANCCSFCSNFYCYNHLYLADRTFACEGCLDAFKDHKG